MQDFTIPTNVQPEVQQALQQIRNILRTAQVPMLRDMKSIRQIPEGSRAYLLNNAGVSLFVKHNGRLYRQALQPFT